MYGSWNWRWVISEDSLCALLSDCIWQLCLFDIDKETKMVEKISSEDWPLNINMVKIQAKGWRMLRSRVRIICQRFEWKCCWLLWKTVCQAWALSWDSANFKTCIYMYIYKKTHVCMYVTVSYGEGDLRNGWKCLWLWDSGLGTSVPNYRVPYTSKHHHLIWHGTISGHSLQLAWMEVKVN